MYTCIHSGGKKKIRGSPGKGCATLHRSAAEEEVVGPGKPGEEDLTSVCSLLPGSCSSFREQCH